MATPYQNSVGTQPVNSTGNNTIDALLVGTKWSSGALTYSFVLETGSVWDDIYDTSTTLNEPYANLGELTATQKSAFISAPLDMKIW